MNPTLPLGWIALLFTLVVWAPACAPDRQSPETEPAPKKLVLLTDSTDWAPGELNDFRQIKEAEGYRMLISGTPGETQESLLARLPWLLQPGVDVLLYDPELAGPGTTDSLVARLGSLAHPARVRSLVR